MKELMGLYGSIIVIQLFFVQYSISEYGVRE